MYDGVHWISKTIRYIMECTHFDDEALECPRGGFNGDSMESLERSISPILEHPSYYLRMVLTIDISIREGRLPDEQDFPQAMRTLIYKTGCFMPLLFESENDTLAYEDSYKYLKGLGLNCGSSPPSCPQENHLARFIEQDRSLFFAMEMGLGP